MDNEIDAADYDVWKRAKVERGIAQAQDRAALTPIERVLDDLGAEARAEADVQAGRLVGHDAVKRWLASLSDAALLPRSRASD